MATTFALQDRTYGCPVELALSTLSGKWKVLILWNLRHETLRYGALKRALPRVTHKMLAQQLRELEADGLVVRTAFAVVPPHVEYALSAEGRRMEPVLTAMQQWGMGYRVPAAAGPPAG